jgi:phosphomannomutase
MTYTSAFAKYCHTHYQSKKIVVGRDGRSKGDVVSNLTIHTLRSCGYDVIDIGIVPTPTVQIATEDMQAAG